MCIYIYIYIYIYNFTFAKHQFLLQIFLQLVHPGSSFDVSYIKLFRILETMRY